MTAYEETLPRRRANQGHPRGQEAPRSRLGDEGGREDLPGDRGRPGRDSAAGEGFGRQGQGRGGGGPIGTLFGGVVEISTPCNSPSSTSRGRRRLSRPLRRQSPRTSSKMSRPPRSRRRRRTASGTASSRSTRSRSRRMPRPGRFSLYTYISRTSPTSR